MFGASVAFVYVLTGITGNLARTKKLPALYRIVSQLVRENRLGRCRIIGVGSRPKQIAEFRMLVYNACKEHVREFSEHFFSQVLWPLFQYHALDLRDQAAYCRFREIAELARGASRSARLVIDVSVLPELYQCFCEGFRGTLESFGPVDDLTTVLFEKPIGEDRRSAAELLKLMRQVFGAAHAKTWDHFLGKEGFRSMLQHRFSTLEIKRRWNSHHVRRINLSITETNGLEGRVYFARTGICRDMVCNHGAAYLSGLVMPEPRTHHPGDIQAALLEGARSFVPVDPACCNLGYYVRNDESNLPGYPEELAGLGLDAQQLARALSLGTSFAGTLVSRAPAWRNSRYFRLPTGITASGTGFSIEVIKRAPAAKKQVEVCFDRGKENLGMDRLVYHLEPGPASVTAFCGERQLWSTQLGSPCPKEAYEQLLSDVLIDANTAWFPGDQMVLACWDMFEPVIQNQTPEVIEYPACVQALDAGAVYARPMAAAPCGLRTQAAC